MVHRLLSRTWPSFAKCITKTVGNAVEKIFRRIELISEADINAMIDADTDTNVKSATAQDDDIEAVDLFVASYIPCHHSFHILQIPYASMRAAAQLRDHVGAHLCVSRSLHTTVDSVALESIVTCVRQLASFTTARLDLTR